MNGDSVTIRPDACVKCGSLEGLSGPHEGFILDRALAPPASDQFLPIIVRSEDGSHEVRFMVCATCLARARSREIRNVAIATGIGVALLPLAAWALGPQDAGVEYGMGLAGFASGALSILLLWSMARHVLRLGRDKARTARYLVYNVADGRGIKSPRYAKLHAMGTRLGIRQNVELDA